MSKKKTKDRKKKPQPSKNRPKDNIFMAWYANSVSAVTACCLVLVVVFLGTSGLDVVLLNPPWNTIMWGAEIIAVVFGITMLIFARRRPFFSWGEYTAWFAVSLLFFPLFTWIGFRVGNCWLDFSDPQEHTTTVISNEAMMVHSGKSSYEEDRIKVKSWRSDFETISVLTQKWPKELREKDGEEIPYGTPIIVKTKSGLFGAEFVLDAYPPKDFKLPPQPPTTPIKPITDQPPAPLENLPPPPPNPPEPPENITAPENPQLPPPLENPQPPTLPTPENPQPPTPPAPENPQPPTPPQLPPPLENPQPPTPPAPENPQLPPPPENPQLPPLPENPQPESK